MNYRNILICSLALLCACSASQQNDGPSETAAPIHMDGDVLKMYQDAVSQADRGSVYTIAIKDQYDMHFTDNTMDRYTLDGVLEVENDTAHLRQNIDANGMFSEMEGYYIDGRFYNTYNGINYYEDMSLNDVEQTMLVPTTPYAYQESQIQDIEYNTEEMSYQIHLNENIVRDFFFGRYDNYGLSQYSDLIIEDHMIEDKFNADGSFKSEDTSFKILVRVKDTDVEVNYTSHVEYVRGKDTTVNITDEMKSSFNTFVAFEDIDTSTITTDPTTDDSVEDTTTKTFEKRIVSRLNYQKESEGVYIVNYNDSQSYMIDFNNQVFEYSNHSIHYVYNWKGDIATMSKCTYEFAKSQASSDCQDTTIDTMKEVKSFLEMELYYCGLSLEDLQREAHE